MPKIILFITFFLSSLAVYADETIVAKVNGAAITAKDLEQEVNRLIPQSTFHGTISEETKSGFREKALNNIIERELEYQDALSKGMKPDKKQVKAEMARIRDQFKSKKDYHAALEQAGLTEDELRTLIEKSVLVQNVVAKTVTEPASMAETSLKDYYNNNKAKFKQPESVKLKLISTKDEKKAKDAIARIKSGEDFGKMASMISEDNYRIMGGDIGYIHRGRVIQEIEDEAFRLKQGEMSGLIKANNTWFIIRVEDKKPEYQLSFDETKDKLKKELEAKRSQEIMDKWLADLRSRAKIEVFEKMQ